jgi:pyocin large subunit-like protein
MTTTDRSAKRRARRIAADEAHSWARNLKLNNPHAKLLLCMLTQYVNGDGICWVSVPTLSEDCELAQNTIRSRLNWLEEIGVIVSHAAMDRRIWPAQW